MSNRKYASNYEKLQKKRRIENLIQSQKGALHKFLTCNKKDGMKSSEETNLNELGDEEVMVEKTIENKKGEMCDNVMVDEEGRNK